MGGMSELRSSLPCVSVLRELSAASAYRADALAARVGITTRHLRRLFKRHFGCSPSSWLREERLRIAHQLLPSASSVKEVAHALAFVHTSHFCRDFRKRFGCRPSELMETRQHEVSLLNRSVPFNRAPRASRLPYSDVPARSSIAFARRPLER